MALRDLVLSGRVAHPSEREALEAWAAWRSAPPSGREEAGRFLSRLGSAAVEALGHWLALADRAGALSAWFGQEALRAMAAAPEATARIEEALDRDIAALDAMISRQLDAVLHARPLRRLEGSWRGLYWLARQLPQDRSVKLRLLPISWREICRDLERAAEFDQSQLFRKIYEDEFGTPGGEPYGLLLVDHAVRHAPGPGSPTDDVAALLGLAQVAAAAFAPLVLAASPELLGLDSYAEAGPAFDLADALKLQDRARFQAVKAREDTRFLGLLLPRVPGRPAWQDDGTRPDGFRYREHAPRHDTRVWTSPVYAFAMVAARAFARYRWPAEIRGAEPQWEATGGVVDTLPAERFPSDPPGPPPRPPVELALTDEQERQIADANLIALVGLELLPEATFGALPSLHRPPRMTTEAANATQRLSAQINNMLCVSRFAHCIKLMGRDMIGAYKTPEEVEFALGRWLSKHVSGLVGADSTAARYPLRDARIEVRERPGRPGVYGCVIHLQPHYQLDDVGAAFRLVTEIAAPRAAA
ncbi:MAG: type VI secretion system contractile sheath large subunit [Acetobacteraceae bacterium]|nr:type VI secretion system contractile sheath large subunit [Acetobacteraceae bacterium]